MSKKYPFIKQNGIKDCAAASLLMIIKYYKGYINMDVLSEMLETNKNGTTAYNIIKVANKIGFNAKGIKTELKEINTSNIILPCIAHVVINKTYKHYIVIYKIDFRNKKIIIGDPQDKIKKVSFNEFEQIWSKILIVLYPTSPIPRNTTNSLFNYSYDILKKYKKEIAQMFLISLMLTIFTILSSFYFKYIIDGINYPKPHLILCFIIFGFVYLFRIITDFCRNRLLIFFNQKLDLELNLNTFKNVLSLPYHYYRNRTTGEIVTKINNLDSVRDMISKVFLSIFVDIPLSLISMIMLFFINSKLFFIALIILLFYIIIVLIFEKILTNQINEVQANKCSVNSYMVEAITGFETSKGLKLEKYINKMYRNKYVTYLKTLFSLQKNYTNQLFLKDMLNTFGQAIIIFFGSLLVLEGELTLGTLLTFNTILIYFLDPIKNIIDLDYTIKEAKISLKNVLNMLEITKQEGVLNKKLEGNIKIHNLSFELNNKNIINNINLTIKKGEKIMIVGPSGSGKSTLFKILMKYYKINRNQIYINDIDYNDYKTSDGISMISQQETLFTDTLYNNILLDNDDLDKFLDITKICEVDEIIKDNSTVYNMLIEENGFNISGGQKQRIILARALMQNFNILLIDEGLNQVDVNLERRILKNIFKKYKDKTILVISHRLENLDLFDRTIKLNNGRIVNKKNKNE